MTSNEFTGIWFDEWGEIEDKMVRTGVSLKDFYIQPPPINLSKAIHDIIWRKPWVKD